MADLANRYFKVLNPDGSTCHGGKANYPLPADSNAGDWLAPIDSKLIWCKNGYHICRTSDLFDWVGPAIFEVEFDGEMVVERNTLICRKVRLIKQLNWNKQIAHQLIIDIVEHILPVYERRKPGDNSARRSLELAQKYNQGLVAQEELAKVNDLMAGALKEPPDFSDPLADEIQEWESLGSPVKNAANALASLCRFVDLQTFSLSPDSYLINLVAEFARHAVCADAVAGKVLDVDEATARWQETSLAEYQWQTARLLHYLDQN